MRKKLASWETIFHMRGVVDVLDWSCSWVDLGGIGLLPAPQNEKETAYRNRFLIHSHDQRKAMGFPALEFRLVLELSSSSHKLVMNLVPQD